MRCQFWLKRSSAFKNPSTLCLLRLSQNMLTPRLHAMVERRERAGPLRNLLLAIEATSIFILTHEYLTLPALQQDRNPHLPMSEVEAPALRNDMASL